MALLAQASSSTLKMGAAKAATKTSVIQGLWPFKLDAPCIQYSPARPEVNSPTPGWCISC